MSLKRVFGQAERLCLDDFDRGCEQIVVGILLQAVMATNCIMYQKVCGGWRKRKTYVDVSWFCR